jgi:arabinogalactan oligomer/maltooligosaccharide transport system substrate-binding protein
MKKILAVLLAGMMAVTAFAGCGGGSTESSGSSEGGGDSASVEVKDDLVDESVFGKEDNIELKVWAPDKAVDLVKKQVEDFKKAYPNKTFKKIEVVAQGEDAATTQLLNDASVAADVFGFASDQLNKLVDAKVISDVAFPEYVTEQNAEETVKAATINNTFYAYPETADNGYYLVYDKSIVSDEQAKTLEGVLEACKAAGKKFIMECGNGYYGCVFAFTGGAKIDGLDENGTQKFTQYDENEAVATLQAFSKLMHDYKGTFTSLEVAQVSSGFGNKTVGAGIDGSWDTVANQEKLGDNFGAAKLPTIKVNGQDKQLISMFGYKYIGVNAASKFPATSQILALYLAGEKCQRERAEQLGWGPSNKKVQQEPTVTNSVALKAIMDQSQNACAQVNIAATLWDPMGNLGNKLIADETKPDDAEFFKKLLNETIKNVRDEA